MVVKMFSFQLCLKLSYCGMVCFLNDLMELLIKRKIFYYYLFNFAYKDLLNYIYINFLILTFLGCLI